MIAGSLGGVVLLLGIIFFVRVGKYDVQITLDDPSITLSVDGDILDIKDGQGVYQLSAGEHKLQLKKDGLKTHVEEFTVTKDGKTALRAVVVKGKLDGLINGEKIDELSSAFSVASQSEIPNTPPAIDELALQFDGIGDYVIADSVSIAAGKVFNFELWIRYEGQFEDFPKSELDEAVYQCPVAVGNALLARRITKDESNRLSANLIVTDSKNQVLTASYDRQQVPTNEWIHVYVQMDKQSVGQIYLNGKRAKGDHVSFQGVQTQDEFTQKLHEFWQEAFGLTLGAREFAYQENKFRKEFQGSIREFRMSSGQRYSEDFTPDLRFSDDESTKVLYHFDEGSGDVLKDSSGNGHHGKIVGAKWVKADATVRPLSALRFDGWKHMVRIPTLKFDGSHALTIEAFVTPEQYQRNQCLVGDHFGQGMVLGSTASSYWYFEQGRRGNVTNVIDKAKYKVGTRVHLASTWDAEEIQLFVNGKRIGSSTISGQSYRPSSQPFVLGRYPMGNGNFKGTIDGVHISRVVRYKDDFTPTKRFDSDASTIALYHFDEGTGDVLKDSSGNGHHGKIIGAKWVKVEKGSSQRFDLLDKVEPATLESRNLKWKMIDGILAGSGNAAKKDRVWSGVAFPHEISGDYDLELELKQSGFAPLQIDLPLGDKQAIRVHLGGSGGALMMIDGKQDKDAAATFRNAAAKLKNDVWQQLTANIRHHGETISIDVALDGIRIGRFNGLRSRITLPHWVKPDPVHLQMAGLGELSSVQLAFRRAVVTSVNSAP